MRFHSLQCTTSPLLLLLLLLCCCCCAAVAVAVLLCCPTWTSTSYHRTSTHAHATASSCCPSLEPHPFRSKEHSTARGTPSESTLATSPPGTGDPHSSEGALPTFRPTRHDGWDGPVLWCPSAAPRVGETRGKTEWRGTHAHTRPEAPMVG